LTRLGDLTWRQRYMNLKVEQNHRISDMKGIVISTSKRMTMTMTTMTIMTDHLSLKMSPSLHHVLDCLKQQRTTFRLPNCWQTLAALAKVLLPCYERGVLTQQLFIWHDYCVSKCLSMKPQQNLTSMILYQRFFIFSGILNRVVMSYF